MGIFGIFRSDNHNDRKSYLKELIKIAKADGHLEKREYEFLMKIGHKLSCSSDEIKDLSDQIEINDPSERVQARGQRLRLIFDLVIIMIIDGSIDPKEMSLCKSIAMKSGFEPEVIDDIVHRIDSLRQSGISLEEASNEAYRIYRNA